MESPPDLRPLLDSWKIALRDEGKSPNTVNAYSDSVLSLLRWQAANGREGLGRGDVAGFLSWILDNGSASTAALRAKAVRAFSAWLADEGEIDVNELAGMKAPTPAKTVVPKLSDGELRDLIAACAADKSILGRRDEAIVRLAAESTTRADELLRMDLPGDIDLRRMVAKIRGKGSKERIIPFGDHTARAIDRYLRMRRRAGLADKGPLWVSTRKTRLGYDGLRKTLNVRAKAAGITGFHPHRLRHTAASRWLREGGSEGGLMAIAGWVSRSQLDRYVADTRAEMAIDEARKLGLGDL
jgi:integrase/recombinase XerD